jgi:predicted amidohydrolase YtcJ
VRAVCGGLHRCRTADPVPSTDSNTAQDQPLLAGAPSQRLSVEDALRAYLRGAYAQAAEDRLGTVEPGKYADLVVLSQDLCEVRPGEMGDIQVDLTMVNGKVVYHR